MEVDAGEFGTLEREIRIDASPEVVFEVISRPEHIREWWSDDASLEPAPGAVGQLVWEDRAEPVPVVVETCDPPRTFSFRWTSPDGELPAAGNSLLVTFALESSPRARCCASPRRDSAKRAGRQRCWSGPSMTTRWAGTSSCLSYVITR